MESVKILGFSPNEAVPVKLPLFLMSVSAGVPVPVDEVIDKEIDLNQYLIEHPATTFFAQVFGVEIKDAGISDGDVLIVDSAVQPNDGRFVLVTVNGEISIKRFREINDVVYLENSKHEFIPYGIEPYLNYEVLGTVTRIIHSL